MTDEKMKARDEAAHRIAESWSASPPNDDYYTYESIASEAWDAALAHRDSQHASDLPVTCHHTTAVDIQVSQASADIPVSHDTTATGTEYEPEFKPRKEWNVQATVVSSTENGSSIYPSTGPDKTQLTDEKAADSLNLLRITTGTDSCQKRAESRDIRAENVAATGSEFPEAEFIAYCRDRDLGASREQTSIGRDWWAKRGEVEKLKDIQLRNRIEANAKLFAQVGRLEAENKRLREALGE